MDFYVIDSSDNKKINRTIFINNKDTEENPKYDLLYLPMPLNQISNIHAINQYIILSSSYEPEKNLRICFQNFLLNESYRHIIIIDSPQDNFFELDIDKQGNARFYYAGSNLSSTENADKLIIKDADTLIENTLKGKGGDDLILDYSHLNRNMHGGKGNAIIMAMENGSKDIDGNEDNDQLFSGDGNDYLTGGEGNDWLSGGKGNDVYSVSRSDGHTTIEDSGGYDITLKDTDIKNFSID